MTSESERNGTEKEYEEQQRPKRKISIDYVYILATALTIALVITLLLIARFYDTIEETDAQDQVRVEIVKSLLQLAVVIIIGSVIAFLIRAVEQKQEQARARAALRTDYLDRLGNTYRNVKAARRVLRAGGLTSRYDNHEPENISDELHWEVYQTEMKRINEAQLVLEGLKIEAESLPAFFPVGRVAKHLGVMEDYLRAILWEYENHSALREAGNTVDFENLKKLEEFTGATKRELPKGRLRLKAHFSTPYKGAVKAISEHLL